LPSAILELPEQRGLFQSVLYVRPAQRSKNHSWNAGLERLLAKVGHVFRKQTDSVADLHTKKTKADFQHKSLPFVFSVRPARFTSFSVFFRRNASTRPSTSSVQKQPPQDPAFSIEDQRILCPDRARRFNYKEIHDMPFLPACCVQDFRICRGVRFVRTKRIPPIYPPPSKILCRCMFRNIQFVYYLFKIPNCISFLQFYDCRAACL